MLGHLYKSGFRCKQTGLTLQKGEELKKLVIPNIASGWLPSGHTSIKLVKYYNVIGPNVLKCGFIMHVVL